MKLLKVKDSDGDVIHIAINKITRIVSNPDGFYINTIGNDYHFSGDVNPIIRALQGNNEMLDFVDETDRNNIQETERRSISGTFFEELF